jgi:hypothetical protein
MEMDAARCHQGEAPFCDTPELVPERFYFEISNHYCKKQGRPVSCPEDTKKESEGGFL